MWWALVFQEQQVTKVTYELILHHVNTCSVERYDPSKDSWEMVASMADKRIHFGVGVMLGFIFVVGGHNGVSHLSSIERYDPHQNQWTVCRPMKEPRTGNVFYINSFVCFVILGIETWACACQYSTIEPHLEVLTH